MNPYSHAVVAARLESLVKPEDRNDYYWGAIVPDIRYLMDMQRQQTHIPSERIVELISQYPHLKSFLLGYLVHCLSDELDLSEIFCQHLPFSILRSKLSRQHIAVILELFYFEHEKVDAGISGMYNEVLSGLGVDEAVSNTLAHSIGQYLMVAPAGDRLSKLFRLLGSKNNTQIEKYVKAAVGFQENWLLRNALFLGIRTGKISEKIVSETAALLATVQAKQLSESVFSKSTLGGATPAGRFVSAQRDGG